MQAIFRALDFPLDIEGLRESNAVADIFNSNSRHRLSARCRSLTPSNLKLFHRFPLFFEMGLNDFVLVLRPTNVLDDRHS
jgi:hypothetical protein